jgi:hypothetical protein
MNRIWYVVRDKRGGKTYRAEEERSFLTRRQGFRLYIGPGVSEWYPMVEFMKRFYVVDEGV